MLVVSKLHSTCLEEHFERIFFQIAVRSQNWQIFGEKGLLSEGMIFQYVKMVIGKFLQLYNTMTSGKSFRNGTLLLSVRPF